MNKTFRSAFCAVLAVILLISVLPSAVFARGAAAAEADTMYAGASTTSAPENYVPRSTSRQVLTNAPQALTEEDTAGEAPRVLLIEDVLPWNSDANHEVLQSITEYDTVTTSEFLDVELEKYGVVIFANDQPFRTYENYTAFKEYLEIFASIGGVIVFGACDAGWSNGELIEALPGDVTKKELIAQNNWVAASEHAIVTGILTDSVALADEDLQSRYCSHIAFNEDSLPAGTTVILRETVSDQPTLVEYPLGRGRVIASGLTWEHNHVYAGRTIDGVRVGGFAARAMEDMYRYAIRVSSIDVDELKQLEQWRYDRNAHAIIVADASGSMDNLSPIQGAMVTVNGTRHITDENGQIITHDYGIQDVVISAHGYRELRTSYNITESSSRIFLLEKHIDDGLPYLNQATATNGKGQSIDLRYQALHYMQDSGKPLVALFGGNWNGHGTGCYQIYQEATAACPGVSFDITEGNILNFAPGKELIPNMPVWIRMVAADGIMSAPVELKLYIDPKPVEEGEADNRLDEGSGTMHWIGNHEIKTDNKLINDYLTTDLSISSELIPYEIAYDYNPEDGTTTAKIVIGVFAGDAVKNILYSKTDAHGFKDAKPWKEFTKMFDDFKENGNIDQYIERLTKKFDKDFHGTRFRSFMKGEVKVGGYYTYTVDKAGNYVGESSGGIALKVDGKWVFGRTIFVSGVPLFFELEAGASADIQGGLSISDGRISPALNAEILVPYVNLQGGVGVRGVATLGVGGGLKNTVILDLDKAGGYWTTDAFFNVKVMFIIDERISFIESEPFGRWGNLEEAQALHVLDGGLRQPVKTSSLSLASRAYLNNRSDWNSTPPAALDDGPALGVLQTGVMPDSMPRLHRVGDRVVMLYINDVPDRAVGSHTQLVYSVYENGAWSQPAAVWESDTADFFFDSTVVDDRLYVTWHKASAVTDTADPEALLHAAAAGSEIWMAAWDSERNAFTGQRRLTDNDTLDMLPVIAAAGGQTVITWVSNEQSDVLENGGISRVNRIVVDNGVCGPAEVLYSTEDSIIQLASAITADGIVTLCAAAKEDQSVSVLRLENGTASVIMDNCNVNAISAENGMFLWYADEDLYRYDPSLNECEKIVLAEDYPVSSDAKYVTDGRTEALVWSEAGRIVASIRADGQWQKPVTLLDDIQEEITYMDAALTGDGRFVVAANTAVFADGVCENAALCAVSIEPTAETRLNYFYADEADWDACTQDITFEISNTGLLPVERVRVLIFTDDADYLDKTIDVSLLPGETALLTERLDLSAVTAQAEHVVIICAEEENDPSDNDTRLILGYTDISLELDAYEYDEKIVFALTVSNASPIAANVAVSVREDDLDGIVLDMKNLGVVGRDESVLYLYVIDRSKIAFEANADKHYFFTVDSLEQDWYTSDNVCAFSVTAPSDVEIDPDGEIEKIVIIEPESVEIDRDKLVFESTDAAPVQLTAEIAPAGTSITEVEWSAADADVVHVTPDGLITPLRPGTTTITATVVEGITDTITVVVKERAHEHTPVTDPGTPATCTGTGLTDGTHCSECGQILTAQEVIPAAGHRYSDYVFTWAQDYSTCTVSGTCTVCGDPVSADAAVTSQTVSADCEKEGRIVYRADYGELSDTVEVTIPPFGHEYGGYVFSWAQDYSACTAVNTCLVCGNAVSHDAAVTSETVPADCTRDGKTVHSAVYAEHADTVEIVIPAAGHQYGEYVFTWSQDHGSCTVSGTCLVCGEPVFSVAEVTAKTVPAGCETDGRTVYTASYGALTDTVEVVLPATGHHYENGVCADCGHEDPETVTETPTQEPDGDDGVPDTGDHSVIGIWLGLVAAASLALWVVLVRSRKWMNI